MSLPSEIIPVGLLATPAAAAGYTISRSLRFNPSDSANLSKTFASAGSSTTWTFAAWVKKSLITTSTDYRGIFTARSSASNYAYLDFSDNGIRFANRPPSGTIAVLQTTPVFRDPSAWFHIVAVYDSDNATSSDRLRIYVNGSRVTEFSTATYPSASQASVTNSAIAHYIGLDSQNSGYLDGYLADIHFIDGQALDPTSFGEFDANNNWQPKAYTGSYGTNGFKLDFSDATSTTTIAEDSSGNNNDWTANNITTVAGNYDSTVSATQSPISGYPVANAFDGSVGSSGTVNWYLQGTNDTITVDLTSKSITASSSVGFYMRLGGPGGSSTVSVTATIGGTGYTQTFTNSTYQDELFTFTASGAVTTIVATLTTANSSYGWGVSGVSIDGAYLVNADAADVDSLFDSPTNSGTDTGAGGEVSGNYCTWNPLTGNTYTASYKNGNLDFDSSVGADGLHVFSTFQLPSTGKWYWESVWSTGAGFFGINSNATRGNNTQLSTMKAYNPNGTIGGVAGSATWTTGDVISAAYNADTGVLQFYKNGVLQPVSISNVGYSTGPWWAQIRQDRNKVSHTNFGQRPFAYAAPSGFKALCTQNLDDPTIADGSTAMDVALWTGNGSTQTISGLGFSPDLVWGKKRNGTTYHNLVDIVRGANKELYSNDTLAETTPVTAGLTGFNSDGFALGANSGWNALNDTYVAWTWDGGSSTVSNTDGSITSSVRANATAGFSIVTYTGNKTDNTTVGHGLNATPEFIIAKNRDVGSDNWMIYHKSFNASSDKALQFDTGTGTAGDKWRRSLFSSTVFGLATGDQNNGNGEKIVAYCFAPVEGYSAFGSYTGNGSTDGPFVFTGMRPRWIMIKNSTSTYSWPIMDSERAAYNISTGVLYANTSAAEDTSSQVMDMLSNGFKIRNSSLSNFNTNGNVYIWAAFAEHPFRTSRAR